jgi:hypothetical protein
MTARKLFLFSIVLSALIFTGMPNPKPKVHATTTPGGADYAIILPFITNVYGFDTTITIGGNSQGLEDAPYLDLYYYDTSGAYQNCYHVSENVPAATDSENTQWVFNLSTTTGLAGHDGMYVAFTNLPDAKATYFISDANTTQATGNGQAVIDYNICGIDQNNKIVRRAGTNPPEDWHLIDPASNQVDPSLLHTTLYFPFVTNAAGWDTGINITNTFDATSVGDRHIHFYFYDTTGAFVCSWDQLIPGGGDTSGIYRFLMSAVNNGALAGQTGSLWAIVDIPFAYGCEFLSCNGSASGAGLPAVVNNNVYGVDPNTHALKRTVEPQDNHTSVVVPFAATANGFETCLAVANTIKRETSINVDFYLYNMDGTRKTVGPPEAPVPVQWRTTLNCDDVGASVLVLMNSSGICVNEGAPFFTDIGNFIGWMLIIVDAPEASVPFVMSYPSANLMDGSMGVVKNKITGVSPETGETLWDNPAPIYTETTFSVPFHSSLVFQPIIFQTWGIDVNTRNSSETIANTVITSNGWDTTGAALIPHPRVVSVAPGAGPILASHMGVDWSGTPNIMGRQEDVVNRSDVVRLTSIIDTGGQKDFVFIPMNCYAFVGNPVEPINGLPSDWSVLPANGGTKKVEFSVNKDRDTKIKVTKVNAAKLGATMEIRPLGGGQALPVDEDGYVTVEKGKQYEMTLTSETKAAGDQWENVLVKENVNVEVNDGVNPAQNFKFTVFWVILDSPNNCHVNGMALPADPYNPDNDKAHPNHFCGIFDTRPLRNWCAYWQFGSTAAGLVMSGDPNGHGRCATNIIVQGKILPQGLAAKDFAYVARKPESGFQFNRHRTSRLYFERGGTTYFQIPGSDDNADDNVGDAATTGQDAALQPIVPAGAPNNLFIYYIDLPSLPYDKVPLLNDVARMRANFKESVLYKEQPCSEDFKWATALSITRGAGGVVSDPAHNANGDNQITIGELNLTNNLLLPGGQVAPFVPPLPFNITGIGFNLPNPFDLRVPVDPGDPQGRRLLHVGAVTDVVIPPAFGMSLNAATPNTPAVTTVNIAPDPIDPKQANCSGDFSNILPANPGKYWVSLTIGADSVLVGFPLEVKAQGTPTGFELVYFDVIPPNNPAGNYLIVAVFMERDAEGNITGGRHLGATITKIAGNANLVTVGGLQEHLVGGKFLYGQVFEVQGNGTAQFRCTHGALTGDSLIVTIQPAKK